MFASSGRVLRAAALLLGLAILGSAAFFAAPKVLAQQLPPGVTAEYMKFIMTPLKKHPAVMPVDTKSIGGCIPTMGYHFANPKKWPFGPIYGYYHGKPVFSEVMISKADFDAGKSWNNLLKPLPGYHIDHVDIWFEPQGHPGYESPHYDIHAWYMSGRQYMYFCGNKSGKKPGWL